MSVKYYNKDDILVVTLTKTPYEYAEKQGDFIVHFSKQNKPVRIEILNASDFLKDVSSSISSSVKKQYISA